MTFKAVRTDAQKLEQALEAGAQLGATFLAFLSEQHDITPTSLGAAVRTWRQVHIEARTSQERGDATWVLYHLIEDKFPDTKFLPALQFRIQEILKDYYRIPPF